MSEREGPTWPGEGKAVAAEISERIRSILADAEAAAEAIRHQAEQDAHARRRAAETESLRIIEDARREAERFLAERIHRVSELSDEILERGQTVVERLDAADQVRSELAGLVTSLGETAAKLANEVRSMPGPKSPVIDAAAADRPMRVAGREPPPAAPDREAPSEPELAPAPEPRRPRRLPRSRCASRRRCGRSRSSRTRSSRPPRPRSRPRSPRQKRRRPSPRPRRSSCWSASAQAERERSEEPEPSPAAVADGDGPELVEVETSSDADGEPQPEDDGEAEPAAVAASPGGDQALGARLVALQMAVAGGNRGEVEAHLRRAFDLSEPGSILDDIFGSGTTADKRVVWPEAG